MTPPKQRTSSDTIPVVEDASFRPDRLAMTMKEFGEATGIPYETVAALVREGRIEHVRAGRMKIIPIWAARKFLRMDQDKPTALNTS
jgi:excisionase family DNA binding protein